MKCTFFNLRQRVEIDFDENGSVRDLILAVYDRYGFDKKFIEYVTVYDMKKYHVVTNTKHSLKKEGLTGAFCFAYFKKGEFLFVEGSWGHHMIKMDAVKEIKKPFDFRIALTSRLVEFEYFVASESLLVKDFVSDLKRAGYLANKDTVVVSHSDITNSKFETAKEISIADAGAMRLHDLIKEYKFPSTMVISFK